MGCGTSQAASDVALPDDQQPKAKARENEGKLHTSSPTEDPPVVYEKSSAKQYVEHTPATKAARSIAHNEMRQSNTLFEEPPDLSNTFRSPIPSVADQAYEYTAPPNDKTPKHSVSMSHLRGTGNTFRNSALRTSLLEQHVNEGEEEPSPLEIVMENRKKRKSSFLGTPSDLLATVQGTVNVDTANLDPSVVLPRLPSPPSRVGSIDAGVHYKGRRGSLDNLKSLQSKSRQNSISMARTPLTTSVEPNILIDQPPRGSLKGGGVIGSPHERHRGSSILLQKDGSIRRLSGNSTYSLGTDRKSVV